MFTHPRSIFLIAAPSPTGALLQRAIMSMLPPRPRLPVLWQFANVGGRQQHQPTFWIQCLV